VYWYGARTCFVFCLMRSWNSSRLAVCTCSWICSCDRPRKSAALLSLAITASGVRHRTEAGLAICCLRGRPAKVQRVHCRVGDTMRPAMAVKARQ
jgi:hypothetical protein